MYIARRPFVFSCLLPALLAAGAVRAQAPDPAALQAAIAGARLDPSRAVTLKNVKLGVGLGKLSLDDGVLIPATAVGGKTIEMVFLGKGRIEVEPPDAIEAGQLELFTGGSRLDEEFKEAVLVVGQDAAVSAVLRRPAAVPDAELTRRAEALYADWRKKGEWKYMSVERGMLLNALHDPVAAGYFAAWFRGGERGDIFYCVQPGEREQVTVGHFIPIEATDKEKRKLVKQISREQRKGRLLGVEVDDLGQWDTWLSASLRTAGGKPAPGSATYEPKKYTLDVNLTERDLRLTGKARIDLEPVIAGSRAVSLILPSDFQVAKVTDPGGRSALLSAQGRRADGDPPPGAAVRRHGRGGCRVLRPPRRQGLEPLHAPRHHGVVPPRGVDRPRPLRRDLPLAQGAGAGLQRPPHGRRRAARTAPAGSGAPWTIRRSASPSRSAASGSRRPRPGTSRCGSPSATAPGGPAAGSARR